MSQQFPLYTTFAQDFHGNVVPRAAFFVYRLPENELAQIYYENGQPRPNPDQADDTGLIQFRVETGKYRIQLFAAGRSMEYTKDIVDVTGAFTVIGQMIADAGLGNFRYLIGEEDSLVASLAEYPPSVGNVYRVNAVDAEADIIPSTWKCTATDAELPGGATPGELYEGKLYVENGSGGYYVFEYVGEGRVDEQTGAVVTLREELKGTEAAVLRVPTIEALRNMPSANVIDGQRFVVEAHSEDVQIGGGEFVFRSDLSAVDDNGIKIRVADYVARGNKGIFIRKRYEDTKSAYTNDFGIVGDYDLQSKTGTPCAAKINQALIAVGTGGTFYAVDGKFVLERPIVVPWGRKFVGPGNMDGPRYNNGLLVEGVAGGTLLVVRHSAGTTDPRGVLSEFVGDGTTKSYELVAVPAIPGSLRVTIDGTVISASNYSVTGSTITFSSAPSSGAAIAVRDLSTGAAIQLQGGKNVCDGHNLFWPDQDPAPEGGVPTPYPPAISGPAAGTLYFTTVKNIFFVNAYEGIHFESMGSNHHVRHIKGYSIYRAGYFNGYQGGCYIDDWDDTDAYFYTGSSFPENNLARWTFNNGIGFEFGSIDWPRVSSTFCYRKRYAYVFSEGAGGDFSATRQGKFVNCDYDSSFYGIYCDGAAPAGIKWVNGSGSITSGQADPKIGEPAGPPGVHFYWHPSESGDIAFTATEFRGGKFADVLGGTRIKFTSVDSNSGYNSETVVSGGFFKGVTDLRIVGGCFDAEPNVRILELQDCTGCGVVGASFKAGNRSVLLSGTTDRTVVSYNDSQNPVSTAFINAASGTKNVIDNNTCSDAVQRSGVKGNGIPPVHVIDDGAITITSSYIRLDTDGSAAQDLVTINGGQVGDDLYIQANTGSRVPTVKHGSGNIRCGADRVLNSTLHMLHLKKNQAGFWVQVAFNENL